jgi:hypothetical protein
MKIAYKIRATVLIDLPITCPADGRRLPDGLGCPIVLRIARPNNDQIVVFRSAQVFGGTTFPQQKPRIPM